MSFVRTLATLAVGFAAARGVDRFRKAGGMEGMKDALNRAGDEGGMGDHLGRMAESFGMPGGRQAMRDMMGRFGRQAAGTTEAAEAGLAGLMNAMQGAAKAGASGLGEMMGAVAGATPAGPVAEQNAKLMIRAMIQAAKADGGIDADERTRILDHLDDASEEEMTFVQAELDAPLDPAALARDTQDNARAQVYSSALMAVVVDTPAEKQYLKQLAAALQLSPQRVREIHEAMGRPAP